MPDYALHSRLGFRLSRLSRIMQARLEAQLAPLGLTRLMWCALTGIGDEGVRSPSDLADYIGMTRPALSRLLRGMEARGLIARRGRASRDGRAVSLTLTDAGEKTLAAARPLVEAHRAHFDAKLPGPQMANLLAALATLQAGEAQSLSDF